MLPKVQPVLCKSSKLYVAATLASCYTLEHFDRLGKHDQAEAVPEALSARAELVAGAGSRLHAKGGRLRAFVTV